MAKTPSVRPVREPPAGPVVPEWSEVPAGSEVQAGSGAPAEPAASPADGSARPATWAEAFRVARDRVFPRLRRLSAPLRAARGLPLREYRGPLVLMAVALVIALAGGGAAFAWTNLRGSPAYTNRALTDATATRQVAAAVSGEMGRIFSYSYTNLPATRRAAASVLSGGAARQYEELFSQVARQAPGEQLTVNTRVVSTGVTWLSGDSARLLVFLDQTATRPGGWSSTTAAQLAVTAKLAGGQWLITGLNAR
jgi:Mce-associated membrane protein